MHKSTFISPVFIILGLAGMNFSCTSQQTNTISEKVQITLLSKIAMPEVRGRIDHISYDPVKHLAFVAALGNNTVEVVNLDAGLTVRTITGLREPQGIAYIPSLSKIVVANGADGKCIFYNTSAFGQTGFVDLKDDADNTRYDSGSHLLYVGYGKGGIAGIDVNSMKQVANIPLDGHPESFQISPQKKRIYVNVPDADEIEVADLTTNKINVKWKNRNVSANYPMALDEKNNRLFIGYRSPATLRMINAESGNEISSIKCTGDADDV